MHVKDCPLLSNLNEDYQDKLVQLETYLTTRLGMIQTYFNDFTEHGINHARRVLSQFHSIIEKRQIATEFSPNLIIVGICACLLHDIGMGPITKEERLEVIKKGFHISHAVQEEIRDEHHLRTARWILESDEASENLSWISKEILIAIAEVAKAHRRIDILRNEFFKTYPDYAFLAALLRLADQMDLSEDRVKHMGITRLELPTDDETQTIEMLKSLADAEIFLQDDDDRLVLKSCQPLDHVTLKTLEALHLLVEDVQKSLAETCDIQWNGKDVLPRNLVYDFHVEGEDSGRHALQAKFSQVWRYLSENLYPEELLGSIPFREAVCNAIDSCRLRKIFDSEVECVVTIKHLGDEIWVEDNGLGMSPRIIENHLKVLGSSYYQTPWFKGDPRIPSGVNVPLIGKYGIGVFSYLLISDEFEIMTATQVDEPRQVLFSNLFGLTLGPLPRNGLECGTILKLKRSRKNLIHWPAADELQEMLTDWFPNPHVPIRFLAGTQNQEIGCRDRSVKHEVVIGERQTVCEMSDYDSSLDDETGTRIEAGFRFKQQYVSDGNQYPRDEANIIDFMRKMRGSRERSKYELGSDAFVMFRGMKLKEEQVGIGPFGKALLGLFNLPNWMLGPPIGWTSSRSKSWISNIPYQATLWLDIDDSDNFPNLTKLKFSNTQRANEVKRIGSYLLENLCSKHCISLLRDNRIPWAIKEYLRFLTLDNWRFDTIPPNKYSDFAAIVSVLFGDMPCLDGSTLKIVNFNMVLSLPKESMICIAPFTRSLEDLEWWGLRRYLVLHPFQMARHRNRFKTEVAVSTKMLRKGLGDRNKEYKVYYVFYGEEGSIGSLGFLKGLLQALGFEKAVVIERNRYQLARNG